MIGDSGARSQVEFRRTAVWLPALLLTLMTFLAVAPRLAHVKVNIVTDTYAEASVRLWSHVSPYQSGRADLFKYSPFFAFLYYPLAELPPVAHVLLWALLNIAVFWAALCAWFPWGKPHSGVMIAAFLLASMELDGSTRYQQANALLVGMTSIGLLAYHRQRFLAAGFVLAVATSFKVLPLLFVAALLARAKRRFIAGVALGGLLSVAAPLLVLTPAEVVQFHRDWAGVLLADLHRGGLMDVASVLGALGYPLTGQILRVFILSFTVLALIGLDFEEAPFAWIAVGLGGLVLTSPRTESPTFVLMAPAIVFLTAEIVRQKRAVLMAWLYGAVLTLSVLANDLWPKPWHPHTATHKVFGALGLWGLAVVLLLIHHLRRPKLLVNRLQRRLPDFFSGGGEFGSSPSGGG